MTKLDCYQHLKSEIRDLQFKKAVFEKLKEHPLNYVRVDARAYIFKYGREINRLSRMLEELDKWITQEQEDLK